NRPETWWPVGGRHTLYAWLAREPGEMAERLAPALLTRADELFATEPATALELLVLVHGWPCRSASLDLVRRIAEGRAPPRCIRAGIKGRDHVREHAADELQRLVEGGGVAGGFAAAITGDARAVFASVDAAAQRALLAAARLGPVVLPVESVLPLLDARDFGLATTAARYLESVDDPAARAALHERGLGPEPRAPWEAALRAERKAAGGPIEIYFWSDEHQGGRETTTIRCFADHVELAHSDEGGREWRRPLPPGEWRELKAFLERNRIDELPDLPCQAADGIWHHYLHVTREGAAALYVNNPGNSWPDDAIYEKLAFRFQSLRQRGEFELHYACERDLPGLEVVVAERGLGVHRVVAKGKDIYVRMGFHRMDIAYRWFRVGREGLAEAVDDPAGERDEPYEFVHPCFWRMPLAGGVLFTDHVGLFYRPAKGEATLLVEGDLGRPTITPNRRWLFANWRPDGSDSDRLLRLDLRTRTLAPVEKPGPAELRSLAWLSVHSALLVCEGDWRDDGETAPHHLLDPESGRARPVAGDFGPFHRLAARCPRNNAEFWVEHSMRGRTVIELYDTRTFLATPVRSLPLDSVHRLHVDETANRLYVVYEGHLLRMPLWE
ncbi:MAG: hypothetical protein ACYS0E_17115, partial [Planctomycetota bacterium]